MIKKFAEKVDCKIPDHLKPFIVVGIHGETNESVDVSFPIFPNGFPVLINVFGDSPKLHVANKTNFAPSNLNLAGQIYGTTPKMEVKGVFGQIGFLLHPLTPYYLFHIKGSSFLNRWISLEEISNIHFEKVLKELNTCTNALDRIPILLRMLSKLEMNKLPPIRWLDECLSTIYRSNGAVSVSSLVEKAEISTRHFGRVFKEIIGVPPKFFCKVVQLNSIFEVLNQSENESLLKLALDYGYYDQAHFIHDFKKLIGDSPERFLMSKDAYVKEYLGNKGF
ncbi:helix-turn-helix domain-containing protein [uncultured Croceitalea sp.]|uniref:helix-turn-helix domain-containing protein n=1 Tax=uncultured Croceitalea sp. TaxID=1798908 RepID=UPI0033066F7F